MRARLAAAALLVLTAACGGGSTPPAPEPVSLAFVVEPGPSSAVSPIAPVVKVELRDAAGNLVTSATSPVTLALAPGAGVAKLAGTTTAQAVAGVASFAALRIARPGTGYRLAASSTGLSGATSAAFDVSVGPPAQLNVVAQPGDGRTSTVLSPALEVTVQDAVGNPIDGGIDVTVTLGSGPPEGILTGTTTAQPVAGRASFPDLAVSGVGAYTLKAQAAGGLSASTITFTLTDAWRSIGPDGGLVAVAADPADPLKALAGGQGGGGLWRTLDGGATWTPIVTARSRTLTPVFEKAGTAWAYGDSLWRSTDGGLTWSESPGVVRSADGKVLSLAFHPVTKVAYAAVSDYEQRVLTSPDGGATWTLVSAALPAGAYLSRLAAGPGGLFVLTSQGFQAMPWGGSTWSAPVSVDVSPFCLVAHPVNAAVAFVGGIYGLHRTADGGATWTVVSPSLFRDIWFDPAAPSTVLALAMSVGVQRSTDGGLTFTPLASPPMVNVASLSGSASRLYLGGDTGPYSSTDGGTTWVPANAGLRAGHITSVAVSPGTSAVVLAGNDAGELHRSADGGATWTRVAYLPGQSLQKILFVPGTPARVYLVNGGYLMASTDAGVTWSDLPGSPPGIGSAALCRQVPATLWVSDSNGTGVWRSTDSGATWTRVYTRPRNTVMSGEVAADAADPLVGYMTMIDYAPGGAATGLYRTQDGGATWTKLTVSAWAARLSAGPTAGSLWVYNGYSVQRSADLGATFSPGAPPISGSAFALAVDPANGSRAVLGTVQSYAGTPNDGVVITTDGGATWGSSRSGHDRFSTYSVAIDPGTPQTIYAGTYGGGLLKSTSGGF
jgi:hypothetical protein